MKRSWLAGVFLVTAPCVFAADLVPSSAMRQIPAIPSQPTAEQCAATETIMTNAQSHAQQDMMRAQQMAMQAMSPAGSRVTDRQGAVIAKVLDPANTSCDMMFSMSMVGSDPVNAHREAVAAINTQVQQDIESRCPVTDFADYRDPACVDPIIEKGLADERKALKEYIIAANALLKKEINGFAQCAEAREALLAEVDAAKLPGNFAAIAHSSYAAGWQQVDNLVQRYESLCSEAVAAADNLKVREESRAR